MIYIEFAEMVFHAMPYLVCCTIILGAIVMVCTRKRPAIRTWLFMLYCIVLAYLLLMDSSCNEGNINTFPFRSLCVSFQYGINNSGTMLEQFVLNILIFVPVGFLEYMNWSDKKRIWLPLTALAVVLMELIQSRVGRVFDAEDIVANWLGIGAGALLSFCFSSKYRFRKRMICGFSFTLFVVVICTVLIGAEQQKKYGYFLINELSIPDKNTITYANVRTEHHILKDMPVYQCVTIDGERVIEELKQLAGFTAPAQRNGKRFRVVQSNQEYIYVMEDGTWEIHWKSGYNAKGCLGAYSESQCLMMAQKWLKKLEWSDVVLVDFDMVSEETYHMSYYLSVQRDESWLLGDIAVEIDTDGMIRSLISNVRRFEEMDLVNTVNWEDALQMLCSYPTAEDKIEDVNIEEAEIEYKLDSTERFLIPCWTFRGKKGADEWGNSICAIAY